MKEEVDFFQFCEENNMMIANTYFQHPKRRLYTRRCPGDIYINQIDFILINKRFRNGVKQARTYPGADVGSDNNPLIIKMNIRIRIRMFIYLTHIQYTLSQY